MKLYIKANGGLAFRLWVPTALLKSKWVIRQIKKHSDMNHMILADLLPMINKSLKKYIKKYGHFTLVRVESADGDKVIIKV